MARRPIPGHLFTEPIKNQADDVSMFAGVVANDTSGIGSVSAARIFRQAGKL